MRVLARLALPLALAASPALAQTATSPRGVGGGERFGWGVLHDAPRSPSERRVVLDGQVYAFVARPGGYYFHPRYGYWHPVYGWWNQTLRCWAPLEGPPPRRRGSGPWEAPPGWQGGPGALPARYDVCR